MGVVTFDPFKFDRRGRHGDILKRDIPTTVLLVASAVYSGFVIPSRFKVL